ncbi:MAG: SpoIID/LytB domain-containing protein [Gemmatimonadetes bacterium]|nr:SpoIID/LytB domain-containing protein [Gemmatimonadota bacterium]
MTTSLRNRLAVPAAALLLALGACADDPTGPRARAGGASMNEVGAAAFNGFIRIGVVPATSIVRIGSEGAYTVRNKVTGEPIVSGSGETLEVSLGSELVTRTSMRLQVSCIFTADPPTDFLARAQALGYATHTVQITTSSGAKCWRVYLGDYPMGTSWSIREAFRQRAIADGLARTDAFWPWGGVTVTEGVLRYDVRRGAEVFSSSNAVVLQSADGLVTISDGTRPEPTVRRRYRGLAEVALNSTGTLAGINELPFEQYLYGVVPRELPPTVWPQAEAQKAQAVAARTWGLASYNKRAADGYNLRATTDDQVYGGYNAEHPVSSAAVDATAGVVAKHAGKLITAYFSSTSGGYTAGYEEWLDGAAPIAYLQAVPDAERGEAFSRVPSLEVFKSHPNPTSLRAAGEGDYESDWSRYHRWTFEWSAAEISAVISRHAQRDVGRVLEINVLERGPSGRVLVIEYVTENGIFRSTRNGIRSSLQFINASGAYENLRSTLFFIEPVKDPRTREVVGFKAYGGGWGHGVGLSQTGAAGMATRGRSYDEILRHYYQGIDLVREY